MNDPNKRIDVNLSSLLSLKAELLRKQEEVNKAKSKQTNNPFVPKKLIDVDKKDITSDRNIVTTTRDNQKFEEYEDSIMLEKSRRVLQAKSKFYDKMTSMGGNLNSDDNCLVMFNHKMQDNKTINDTKSNNYSSSNDSSDSEDENKDNDKPKNSNEEWVEYTDCLGRSRQCLRKDLEFFKKKDTKLAENIQPRELNQNAPMWMIDTKGSNQIVDSTKSEIGDDVSDMCTSIMSKHDQQKMNWEKKEQENVFKEDVHYQDVLFDEARQHGVGYYAFSTDDDERAKQRKELDELREKTLASQKIKQTQKEQRDKIIAERVRAAKNRQRARSGLPPLEDEPVAETSATDTTTTTVMTKEEEKLKKREEKLKRRKEKEEKRREDERNNHIRPWDEMKDGISSNYYRDNSLSSSDDDDEEDKEWQYKPQKEPMSQQQWNELQRNKRNPFFAPPPPVQPKEIRSFRAVPPPSHQQYDNSMIDNNSRNSSEGLLYFSSKKQQQSEQPKKFIKRNYQNNDDTDYNIPIRNELNENYYDSRLNEDDDDDEREMKRSKGAEIPPPPTFEYYGPTNTQRRKQPPKQHLQDSIEAGLKFIRNQSDKGVLPTKSNWTANADY